MSRLVLLVLLLLAAASPAGRLAAAFEAYSRHDDRAAASGFRALAIENSAVAETMLGAMYAAGRVGRADPAMAAAYWLRAAERGYAPAQIALARALADGRGVHRDRAQAYQWARIAARRGDGPARADANALTAALAPALSAAEATTRAAKANAWRPWAAVAD